MQGNELGAVEQHGEDEQDADVRGDQAADHGRRQASHRVRTGPGCPQQRQQADERRHHRHRLGTDTLHGPVMCRMPQVIDVAHPSFGLETLKAVIQVQEHDKPRLGREPRQGDHPHPHGQRQVVAEQVDQPDRADHAERQAQRKQGDPQPALGCHVQKEDDQHARQRHDHQQAGPGRLHLFILPRPEDAVARR